MTQENIKSDNQAGSEAKGAAGAMAGEVDKREIVLSHLRKIPIVQIACEKAAVGRTTYYNWRKADPEFAKRSDEAIAEGEGVITDLTEAQLIALSREKHFPAIMAWLRAHSPKYGNKVEITAAFREPDAPLSAEQQELLERALKMAAVSFGPPRRPRKKSHRKKDGR